ncbi:hypothetical protein V8B55DRAFT_1568331 [Mucor lusitanicus]|uniref:Uncharacterized protein n=2 Tax=Mucor circinelloides f. lusitanicus TaxID=29924 RepID=A0A168P2I3_MUCCL|nr:hypothetical protein FB192DRAFT_1346470 [Mucor lusitanicus]OAD07068.1 hypothetical protein MUCCIDRAFT_77925 [Mucor lusitanicus CBS 277.49]
MLQGRIVIQSNTQAVQLHRHLSRDINLARSIRYLSFDRPTPENQLVSDDPFVQLIKLAFTPNTMVLCGRVSNHEFYRQLVAIAKSFLNQFDRLTYLPASEFTGEYLEALYTFKRSIRVLNLYLPSITRPVFTLPQFDKVTALFIRADLVANTLFLDRGILDKCLHLVELTLEIFYVGDTAAQSARLPYRLPPADSEDYLKHTVTSLKKLRIVHHCSADMLSYLMRKYPKIESIYVDVVLFREYVPRLLPVYVSDESHTFLFNRSFLQYLHQVPLFEYKFNLHHTGFSREEILRLLKTDQNTVAVKPPYSNVLMHVKVEKKI